MNESRVVRTVLSPPPLPDAHGDVAFNGGGRPFSAPNGPWGNRSQRTKEVLTHPVGNRFLLCCSGVMSFHLLQEWRWGITAWWKGLITKDKLRFCFCFCFYFSLIVSSNENTVRFHGILPSFTWSEKEIRLNEEEMPRRTRVFHEETLWIISYDQLIFSLYVLIVPHKA